MAGYDVTMDMEIPLNRELAEVVGSRAPWADLPREHREIVRKMASHFGLPNEKLDAALASRVSYANQPQFWRDIWKSWAGANDKQLGYVITEVMARGKTIQDKFNLKTFGDIIAMPQYQTHGDLIQLTWWEKKCGILEEVSSKAPAHETEDSMRTSAQSLAQYGDNFRAPIDFPNDPYKFQRYQMEMDRLTKSCLKTWMFLIVRSLVREGQISAYETMKREHKTRMIHKDFVNYWRYINGRTFCFAKDGTSMVGLETRVCTEMSLTRTIKPTSVLTAIGSARFMEFIRENRTYSVQGESARQNLANDTNEDSALNLSRLGRTPTYHLELDESIVFNMSGTSELTDPMKHTKFVSQFALMCPMWQKTRDDLSYHTDTRSIEVMDANSNLLARLSLRDAFHYCGMFQVGTPHKFTSHGPLLLTHLCKKAGGNNNISHRLSDGLSGMRSDYDHRRSTEQKYNEDGSSGGGGGGGADDESDDEGDDDDDCGDDNAASSSIGREDTIRRRKEREFRKFMSDDDQLYSFTSSEAHTDNDALFRQNRLSSVDQMGLGINLYNLCYAQGVLAQVVHQLLAKPTTVSKLLRMVGSQRDDKINVESRKIHDNAFAAQRNRQFGRPQGPRSGFTSSLHPIVEPEAAMSSFAAAKRAGFVPSAGNSRVPTSYVSIRGTNPASITMSNRPPAHPGTDTTVARLYGSSPPNLSIVHPNRYTAPRNGQQPSQQQQQHQQQQQRGAGASAAAAAAAAAGGQMGSSTGGASGNGRGTKFLRTMLFNFLMVDEEINGVLAPGAQDLAENFVPTLDYDPIVNDAILALSERLKTCITAIENGVLSKAPGTNAVDYFRDQVLTPIMSSVVDKNRMLTIWGRAKNDTAALQPADSEFLEAALKINCAFALFQRLCLKSLLVEPSLSLGAAATPSWSEVTLRYAETVRDGSNLNFDTFRDRVMNGILPTLFTKQMQRNAKLRAALTQLQPFNITDHVPTNMPTIKPLERELLAVMTKFCDVDDPLCSHVVLASMHSALLGDQVAVASNAGERSDQDDWIQRLIGSDPMTGLATAQTRMATFKEYVSKISMATAIQDQYIVDAMLNWRLQHPDAQDTRQYPFLPHLARKCEEFSTAAINDLFDTPAVKLRIRTLLSELALVPTGNSTFEQTASHIIHSVPMDWKAMDRSAQVVLADAEYHSNAQEMLQTYRNGRKKTKATTRSNPICAKRGYNEYRTTDPQQIERLLMRVRLTRQLFNLLLDDNIIFPMSFIIWRMAIEIGSGATIFYVKGDPTGFLCIRDAHVGYAEVLHTQELEVQVKFHANLLVHAPDNIAFIPDTYPMEYKRGCGVSWFSIDTDQSCFYSSSDALRADLHSFVVDYDYVPRDIFLSIYGKCDTNVYVTTEERDMYPTASIYRELWNIPNPSQEEGPDQHILSPHFYHYAEPKKLWLAFRSYQRVFADSIDGNSHMKEIDGEDAMGRIKFNGDIGLIGGVDEFAGNGMVPMGRGRRT